MDRTVVFIRHQRVPGVPQRSLEVKAFTGPINRLRAASMAFNALREGAEVTLLYQWEDRSGVRYQGD